MPSYALADGGVVELTDGWLDQRAADEALSALRREIPWEQGTIVMFGRPVQEPRLSAWLGDEGASYTYAGRAMKPHPWTPTLASLRQRLVTEVGHPFDSVLANRYRDGQDSMGFHADDEPELGENPVIASVSLGASRQFHLRHRRDRTAGLTLRLEHGSLLLMSGTTQRFYRHAVPKTTRAGERINLTFRHIVTLPE